MARERCYCCGRFMPESRGYPPLEEDRCEDCESHERPSRIYRTGRRADYFAAIQRPVACSIITPLTRGEQ
jgi:hypothetical protein